ncbi:MAG TPA: bifunctional ornithine acetyltransferase/N-acetylglutamate synthase, partial [Hyphomicrobiales bacterium]|nr:bifunctional ornithine acetyltransferase/N-acetylglutamate synthase [Hyphomicrobiales bacterium]
MTMKISPLAPANFPQIPPVEGIRLASGEAGVRYAGRTDVLVVLMDKGTTAAGVLTRSKCPSAPVDWCRQALSGGKARALVVNSGNANAFTGAAGVAAARATAKTAAKVANCTANEVFLASTGVIGEPLEAARIEAVLAGLAEKAAPGNWEAAARAIMTTDTFPKGASR